MRNVDDRSSRHEIERKEREGNRAIAGRSDEDESGGWWMGDGGWGMVDGGRFDEEILIVDERSERGRKRR